MRTRLLTAVLVAGSTGLGLVPMASAAAPSTVAPTVEAWYQPDPACGSPVGCVGAAPLPVAVPAEVPTSPFPAGTLHVGVSGGQETARTYLGVDGAGLGGLSAATLVVPLDVAPGSGTTSPETAKLQVCLTREPVVAAEGSLAAPPAADCAAAALVSYVATPAPHLEADLGPLLAGLPRATGLVLLPDATGITPTDAWRVVFSARSRTDAAKTPPASLAVVAAEQAVQAPSTPDAGPAQPDAAPLEAPGLDLPGLLAAEPDLVAGPLPAVPVTAGAPVVAGEAPVVQVQPVAFPETIRVGYAYPVVWLLPLVLLVVVPMVARTLTRDLADR